MSRLIDADEFYKTYCELFEETVTDEEMERVAYMIHSTPTAYSVESVVDGIHKYFCKVIDECEGDNVPHEILAYNKAVCKIVEAGGIDERD